MAVISRYDKNDQKNIQVLLSSRQIVSILFLLPFFFRLSLLLNATDKIQNLPKVRALFGACADHPCDPVARRVPLQPLKAFVRPRQVDLVGDDRVRPPGEPLRVLLQLGPQRLELLRRIRLAEVDDVDEADAPFDVPQEGYSEALVLMCVLENRTLTTKFHN